MLALSGCAPKPPTLPPLEFGDDPKGRASRYLYENGESSGIDVVSVTDFLGRAYNFQWGSAQVPRIVEENSSPGSSGYLYLRLFGHRLPPEQTRDPIAIGINPAMGNLIYLPVAALHCDSFPLPDDFFARLDTEREKGGYFATHALVALKWGIEQGCIDAVSSSPLVNRLIDALESELASREVVDDLFAELLAMVAYGGRSPDPSAIVKLIQAQRPDGSVPPDEAGSYPEHSTALALMALYISEEPTAVTWITDPGPSAAPARRAP